MSRAGWTERACYGAAALALLAAGAVGASATWSFERELLWIRGAGWAALIALVAALSVSPLAQVSGRVRGRDLRKPARAARRALGICAAALASVHATVALTTYLSGSWMHLLELAWLRAGVLALSILLPLWLTSHPRAVRALRVKLWKPLHRLALVAAALAFQHALLSPLAPRAYVLLLLGVFAVGVVWRGGAWSLGLAARRRQRKTTPSQAMSQSES